MYPVLFLVQVDGQLKASVVEFDCGTWRVVPEIEPVQYGKNCRGLYCVHCHLDVS